MDTSAKTWDDTILPFQLDKSDIRGRVARLDGVLEGVLKQLASIVKSASASYGFVLGKPIRILVLQKKKTEGSVA